MTVVEQIAKLELVKVQFRLEFLEPFHFDPEMIFHWRKELVRGARRAVESGNEDPLLFDRMLDPRPADDPYARKQFQKPSPPFVVDPVRLTAKEYIVGDVLPLEVLFPGEGVRHAIAFARMLIGLGELGLFKGEGRFSVTSVFALTHHQGWQPVWQYGTSLVEAPLPILNAQWLIEPCVAFDKSLLLQFVTPARLLKNNRPLFNADFKALFPYLLRRVTSVLYSCCHLELNLEVDQLMNSAAEVRTQQNKLVWTDWRQLDAERGPQGVGGLMGTLQVDYGLSEDLYAILRLAELFNIGKGACYGAGCFVLDPVQSEMAEKR